MVVNKINNMAAILDLGQVFHTEQVSRLPPRAPDSGKPHPRGFQVRGHLFPASNRHRDLKQRPQSASTVTGNAAVIQLEDVNNKNSSSKPRRVQSAHARVEGNSKLQPTTSDGHFAGGVSLPGNNVAVYDVNLNVNVSRDTTKKKVAKQSPHFCYGIALDKAAGRPGSAKSPPQCWIAEGPSHQLADKDKEKEKDAQGEDLKPSVFGYRLKRQVFGSSPDIFTSSTSHLSAADFPFKLDKKAKMGIQCGGNLSAKLGNGRDIPSHLEPLRPWLTQNVAQDVIGVDPRTCLVFLPLNQSYDDLPVVPLQ